jgi:hypothetical protein
MPATLSDDARDELRKHLVPEAALEVIAIALPTIEVVCDRAGREYDEEDGDDPMLFGQQCSRRAKNLVARDVLDTGLEDTVVTRPNGSLDIFAAGTHVHIYAAGDEDGAPRLKGGKTKPAILDACLTQQLRLFHAGAAESPEHLVIAYRATPSARGVEKVVVGVPSAVDAWEFGVKVYDRSVHVATDRRKPTFRRFDAGDNQRDAPVIQLRPQPRRDEQ